MIAVWEKNAFILLHYYVKIKIVNISLDLFDNIYFAYVKMNMYFDKCMIILLLHSGFYF